MRRARAWPAILLSALTLPGKAADTVTVKLARDEVCAAAWVSTPARNHGHTPCFAAVLPVIAPWYNARAIVAPRFLSH